MFNSLKKLIYMGVDNALDFVLNSLSDEALDHLCKITGVDSKEGQTKEDTVCKVYDWSIERRSDLNEKNTRESTLNSIAISQEFMEWDDACLNDEEIEFEAIVRDTK
jgi:hypothetical protein